MLSPKNKYLIIGEVFYPEDFIINDLVKEWGKKGYEIEVLTRTPSYPTGKIFTGFKNKVYQVNYFGKIKVHRFPVIQGYQKNKILKLFNYLNFVFWGSLIVLLIGKKYKGVFVYQTGPLTIAIPGIIIKKLYSSKLTIWTQDLWPDTVYAYGFNKNKLLEKLLDDLVRFVYKNSDNILVSCEGFIAGIKKYVPNKKIEWIPNWSLVDFNHSIANIKLPGRFNFTFAGNIGKVQNLENVISGFSKISEKYDYVYLNIVGDGSNLLNLKNLVEDRNLKNILFHGRKPLSTMPGYFEASDVLIISLKDEEIFNLTIPSKFQAYLKSNKPIMGIIGGELKELINKYNVGKVALPSNISEIAKVFENFLTEDKKTLERMGNNAKIVSDEIFNREILINKISNIFFAK
ncbi:MAG: glycosyltransferase family 4 protein [Ignavibacteriaceae bacterium]